MSSPTGLPPAPPGRPLEGHVALVTGAGGGLEGNMGAGIAHCLAARGATVHVNDLTEDRAARTAGELAGKGYDAAPLAGDVSLPGAAADLVGRVEQASGRLDILVNNAGIAGRSAVVDTSDEEWRRVLGVNLDAPFMLTRAALRVMRPRGYGRIVNVASIASIRISYLAGVAYTASKAGLLGLTRHAAVEAARYGITVNAVLPGVTVTPLIEELTTRESLEAIARTVPAQRAGRPVDVGWTVAWLASPEAAYVTGTGVPVDGAMTVLPGDFSSYAENSHKDLG
jgi:NAD(P)-dependent dehydrogenase (short-subunit alcohol dehydrogenase family)